MKGLPCLPESCAFCGSTSLRFTEFNNQEGAWCNACGNSFVKMAGQWKFDNEGWPEENKSHNMRHRITRVVRSELHDYVHGAAIPPKRLKVLIALLLDHHCHLEGIAVRERIKTHPPIPPPRPRPMPKPYKIPHKPPLRPPSRRIIG